MTARQPKTQSAPGADATAQEVWLMMSDLVLDHERRRQVTEALGMSFSRARAVRYVARQPMSMKELASALNIDPPNVTVLVDELESQGLVRRQPHPTDRRAKIVKATRKGKSLARTANDILASPPPPLAELDAEDLATLRRILGAIAQDQRGGEGRPPPRH
jgi:DNA-binding MarR family transcriptional regulator